MGAIFTGLHAIVQAAGLLLGAVILIAIVSAVSGLVWIDAAIIVVAATLLVVVAARRRRTTK